eukprot:TRINITY_DN3670_c0_g2_i1.p1 TRINITY_DN3670_c0_g2~~TRINITY_DN3670_c0_g2_i1.p1  ORF type:complete len:347 (+),score=88.90 TRINITY_DN3670_c0_g2_i1:104-1144(+)
MQSGFLRSFVRGRGFATSQLRDALNGGFRERRLRNAIRVEKPSVSWLMRDLEIHSSAFAHGLLDLGFAPGDKLVLWLGRNHVAESAVCQLGAALAGITLVPCVAQDEENLGRLLRSTESRGIVFSPNVKHGERKRSELIQSLIPQLENILHGSPLQLQEFPRLKTIISAGFYSQPGAIKFRSSLVYANPNFTTTRFAEVKGDTVLFEVDGKRISHEDVLRRGEELRTKHKIKPDDHLVVTGDTNNALAFSFGLLNCITQGNFLVLTGAQELQESTKYFSNQQASAILLDEESVQVSTNAIDKSRLTTVRELLLGARSRLNLQSLTSAIGEKISISQYNQNELSPIA